jgi:hypothetical protein
MKRQNAKPSPWIQEIGCHVQEFLQGFQFPVHGDPYGLKCPCGRMDAPPTVPSRNRLLDDLGQLQARPNGFMTPVIHNTSCNTSSPGFFSIPGYEVGKLPFRHRVYE